jgi:hypothetical protein
MDSDPIRINLPGPAHVSINQCLLAAAERRAFGDRDQLLRLSRQKRQGDRANALDLETGCENFAGADGAKIAGTPDAV